MGGRGLSTIVCALALVACGGGEAGETDAGLDARAAETDSGGGDVDASSAGDAGMVADAASPIDATSASDAPSSSATITLSDVAVYSNCMPIVAPDPILAFWSASVTGAGAASGAVLSDATLTIRVPGGSTVVQRLTVDMPVIALTAGAGSAMQRKTAADANPSEACGALCGAGVTYELELIYDVGGALVTVTDTGDFSCVY